MGESTRTYKSKAQNDFIRTDNRDVVDTLSLPESDHHLHYHHFQSKIYDGCFVCDASTFSISTTKQHFINHNSWKNRVFHLIQLLLTLSLLTWQSTTIQTSGRLTCNTGCSSRNLIGWLRANCHSPKWWFQSNNITHSLTVLRWPQKEGILPVATLV